MTLLLLKLNPLLFPSVSFSFESHHQTTTTEPHHKKTKEFLAFLEDRHGKISNDSGLPEGLEVSQNGGKGIKLSHVPAYWRMMAIAVNNEVTGPIVDLN